MAKEIQLTQGKAAIVDDADFNHLAAYKWHAKRASTVRENWYAARMVSRKLVLMHRVILANPPADTEVDHQDGNGLNNLRSNLRLASKLENTRNSCLPLNSTSGFKGVYCRQFKPHHRKRWKAQISVNNQRIYLGSFAIPEDAAKAYDRAAMHYHKEFAKLNFPILTEAMQAVREWKEKQNDG